MALAEIAQRVNGSIVMSLPVPVPWLQAVEAASHLATPTAGRDGRLRAAGRQASVLIVEEEQELRSLLTLLVGAAGFRVHAARDEIEGLKLFRRVLPDAVVTDLDNTISDGAALAATIRREEPGRPTPIVVLTRGAAVEEEGMFSIDKGADLGGLLHGLIHLLGAA